MNIDLHTHSSASDGSLAPLELVRQAESTGLELLSITDHDTVQAYSELETFYSSSMRLVQGVEFSTQWKKIGIHVIGLGIQLDSEALSAALDHQSRAREKRAKRIAEKLEKLGLEDAWPGVRQIAGNSIIGRPHFAELMLQRGMATSHRQAFDRYLGAGKAGDVKQYWAPPGEIISWIREAGGIAILAHPGKYRLSRTRLSSLLDDFRQAGGEAMEVISGKQEAQVTRELAKLCQQKKLLASAGSDFHKPGQSWAELGSVAALPPDCTPVWQRWC